MYWLHLIQAQQKNMVPGFMMFYQPYNYYHSLSINKASRWPGGNHEDVRSRHQLVHRHGGGDEAECQGRCEFVYTSIRLLINPQIKGNPSKFISFKKPF